MLQIERFIVSIMQTNCYFVTDKASGFCAVVDPGAYTPGLTQKIEEAGGRLKYVLLTHGHFDHIGKADEIRKQTGAKIVIGADEEEFLRNNDLNLSIMVTPMGFDAFDADILLGENGTVSLGETEFRLIKTPGHTKGGACYIAGDVIFTGDTLMKETVGRTDFPTGSYKEMMESLKKLGALEGDYTIYPGHDDKTTLQHERENNVYMGNMTYEDFD